MPVFGASALASHLKLEAPRIYLDSRFYQVYDWRSRNMIYRHVILSIDH